MRLTNQAKLLIKILTIFSIVVLTIAYFYYRSINKAEDSRILEAKMMLLDYDKHMAKREFDLLLKKLDSAEAIYSCFSDYANSFEIGVIHNNRASILLNIALYEVNDTLVKDEYLRLAEKNLTKSMNTYEQWMEKFIGLSVGQLYQYFEPFYVKSTEAFGKTNPEKMLKKRVEATLDAQIEAPRRLSVAYTNLGIVQRHQLRQDEAIQSYLKAIELWDYNITAKNNLRVLMGEKLIERSTLEKFFPPERLK